MQREGFAQCGFVLFEVFFGHFHRRDVRRRRRCGRAQNVVEDEHKVCYLPKRMSVTIKLDLPDAIVKEAEANGLLQSAPLGNLLVGELQRRKAAAAGIVSKEGASGEATRRIEAEFKERAERWAKETAVQSSPSRRFMHEDYQTIMSMGEAVIPLILRRLEGAPDDWFWALKHLAREDAAKGAQTFSAAVAAWLDWGRKNGFIS